MITALKWGAPMFWLGAILIFSFLPGVELNIANRLIGFAIGICVVGFADACTRQPKLPAQQRRDHIEDLDALLRQSKLVFARELDSFAANLQRAASRRDAADEDIKG